MPDAAKAYEVEAVLPGTPMEAADPEQEAMVSFEKEMNEAKTPEAKEAARRNRTEAAKPRRCHRKLCTAHA